MAKGRDRRSGPRGPERTIPENDSLALAEHIVGDRKERLDKIQDEICTVLGVPNDEVFSSVVLKEFPYLRSEFDSVVKPAVAELMALYDGSQAKLAPSEEGIRHNELVIKIDDFLARLEGDLQKLIERKGVVQKDPAKLDGDKKEKVEKVAKPTDSLPDAEEIFNRAKAVKSHIERFSADSHKNKVEDIKRLSAQVVEIKRLYESVPEGDKKVAELSRGKYLERLRTIDTEILQILGELEDERLSHIASGEYKKPSSASKTKAGPYESSWGMYDRKTFYTTPDAAPTESAGAETASDDLAFIPPHIKKPGTAPINGENALQGLAGVKDSGDAASGSTKESEIPPDSESYADVARESERLFRQIKESLVGLAARFKTEKIGQDPELRKLLEEAEAKTNLAVDLRDQITGLATSNFTEQEKLNNGLMRLGQMKILTSEILELIRQMDEKIGSGDASQSVAESDVETAEMETLRGAFRSDEELVKVFGSLEAAQEYTRSYAENLKFIQEYRDAKKAHAAEKLARNTTDARRGPLAAAARWFSDTTAEDAAWKEKEAKMAELERRRFALLNKRREQHDKVMGLLRAQPGDTRTNPLKLKELSASTPKWDVEKRITNHFVYNAWRDDNELRELALAQVAQERNGTWAGKTLNTIKGVTAALGKHRTLVRGVGLGVAVGIGIAAAPAAALAAGAAAGATYMGRVAVSAGGAWAGAGVGRWLGTKLFVERNLQRQQEFKTELGDKKLTLDNFEQLQKEWSLTKEDERKAKKIRSVATVVGGVIGGGGGAGLAYALGPDIGLDTNRAAPRPAAAAAAPVEHMVRQGDHSLWRITESKLGGRLDGLPLDQRNRILTETFNEIQANPELRNQLGLRPGSTVHQIYPNDRLNLRVVDEILERKTGAVPLPPPPPPPPPPPIPGTSPWQQGLQAAEPYYRRQELEQALSQTLGASIDVRNGAVPDGVEVTAAARAGVGTAWKISDRLNSDRVKDEMTSNVRSTAKKEGEESLQRESAETKAGPHIEALRPLAEVIAAAKERAKNREAFSPKHIPPAFSGRATTEIVDQYTRIVARFEAENGIKKSGGLFGLFDKKTPEQLTVNLSFEELSQSLKLPDREISAVGIDAGPYRRWAAFVAQCVENLVKAGFRREELHNVTVVDLVLLEAERQKEEVASGSSLT